MREAIERAALNNARRRQELNDFISRSQGSQTSRIGANLAGIFKRRQLDREMAELQPQLDALNRQRRSSLAEAIGGVNPDNFSTEDLQKLRFAQLKEQVAPSDTTVPSAIQVQREIIRLREQGEGDKAQLLERTAKLNPKGFVMNPVTGQLEVDPSFVKGKGDIKFSEKQGELAARLNIEPNLVNLIETSKQKAIASNVAEIERQKRLGTGEVSPKDKIKSAKSKVTANLTTMAELYTKLDTAGAIVNIENNSIDNLMAAAESSVGGQFISRVLGTDAQSFRNQINSIRPLLINDIRQATEMGAKGMDSEKELAFYLEAATNPNRDLQSNMAALAVLDRAFGLGQGLDKIAVKGEINKLQSEFENSNDVLETLPQGAKQIGTSGGKPVYETPDGKRFIQE